MLTHKFVPLFREEVEISLQDNFLPDGNCGPRFIFALRRGTAPRTTRTTENRGNGQLSARSQPAGVLSQGMATFDCVVIFFFGAVWEELCFRGVPLSLWVHGRLVSWP
jgi:hypothetical protein